ncbi:ran-binding protein 9-like [Corapipo altera]|uniref:ran-binding protein 9-like n=1 Tax=Corapipo altera TaxID=415028 RepID=UPI000FD67532|nr:ran-binding protein 9-like [Corapipo altera]
MSLLTCEGREEGQLRSSPLFAAAPPPPAPGAAPAAPAAPAPGPAGTAGPAEGPARPPGAAPPGAATGEAAVAITAGEALRELLPAPRPLFRRAGMTSPDSAFPADDSNPEVGKKRRLIFFRGPNRSKTGKRSGLLAG